MKTSALPQILSTVWMLQTKSANARKSLRVLSSEDTTGLDFLSDSMSMPSSEEDIVMELIGEHPKGGKFICTEDGLHFIETLDSELEKLRQRSMACGGHDDLYCSVILPHKIEILEGYIKKKRELREPEFIDCSLDIGFAPIGDTPGTELLGQCDDCTYSKDTPFSFPWIDGESIGTIGVSTNGVISIPPVSSSLCCGPYSIEVGSGQVPRISVAHADLDSSSQGGLYYKEGTDRVTISWENPQFWGSTSGSVNAQTTLHNTGSVTMCYGSGDTSGNTIAAGLEDSDLAYPNPLFDANGLSSTHPLNMCACFLTCNDKNDPSFFEGYHLPDANGPQEQPPPKPSPPRDSSMCVTAGFKEKCMGAPNLCQWNDKNNSCEPKSF